MRIRIVIILLCVVKLGFSQSELVDAELKNAQRLINDQQYEQALIHIQNALDVAPTSIEVLEEKITAVILLGNEKDYLKELDKLIISSPQTPEYYYIRGVLYIYRQKPSRAVENFENAIYYNIPEEYNYKVFLNRGLAYYNIGDLEKAEQDFIAAAEYNDDYPAIYQSWGMLKYEEGDYEMAIEYFAKANKLKPENAVTLYNLGMAYYRNDNMEKACTFFNQACVLGHKNACELFFIECSE